MPWINYLATLIFNLNKTITKHMNINSAFPSEYLKASDLGNASPTVTIASVEMASVGQGKEAESKVVLKFVGKERGLVLNKTNANTIQEMYGPETDDWIGKRITLRPAQVEYQGKMVWAIRVSLQKPAQAAPAPAHGILGKPAHRAAPAPAPVPDEPELPPTADESDTVPF